MGKGLASSKANAYMRDSLLADSFSGHTEPTEALGERGAPSFPNSEAVYEILNSFSEKLQDIVDELKDPRAIYPTVMREITTILSHKDLPLAVIEAIKTLRNNVSQDIKTLHEKDTPNRSIVIGPSDEQVAQRVIKDIKDVSWVSLDDEEVMNQVQIREIDISHIPSIREFIPELKDFDYTCGAKGGAARVALKLLALQDLDPRSEQYKILVDSLKIELPLSDLDLVITAENPNPNAFAEKMGVHPADLEVMSSFHKEDLYDHLGRRDLLSNQAILTNGKLIYTQKALDELQTNPGEAQSIVPTVPGLFGRECFYVGERKYLAANTLYRLIKMVAEGKNTHFQAQKFNLDAIKLGKYWPTMIRKWVGKENRAEIFARAYSCAKQMGTTQAATPAEFFEEILSDPDNEDFDFGSEQTLVDVSKWLTKKYIVFLEKIIRRRFRLRPPRIEDVFASQDTTKVTVRPTTEEITPEDLEDIETVFAKVEALMPQHEEEDDDAEEKPETTQEQVRNETTLLILKQLADAPQKITERVQELEAAGIGNARYVEIPNKYGPEYGTKSRRIAGIQDGYVYFEPYYPSEQPSKAKVEDFEIVYTHPRMGVLTETVRWHLKEGVTVEEADQDTYDILRGAPLRSEY